MAYWQFALVAERHDWNALTFEGLILACTMGLLGVALLLSDYLPWGHPLWYHVRALVPVAGFTRAGVLILKGDFQPPARIWYCICPVSLWALGYLGRLVYRLDHLKEVAPDKL